MAMLPPESAVLLEEEDRYGYWGRSESAGLRQTSVDSFPDVTLLTPHKEDSLVYIPKEDLARAGFEPQKRPSLSSERMPVVRNLIDFVACNSGPSSPKEEPRVSRAAL